MSYSEVPSILGSLVRLPNCGGRSHQDVTLRVPGQIHYILFENYYVHTLVAQHRSKDSKDWVPCWEQPLQLMENPWCEGDAQHTHCVNVRELMSSSKVDLGNLYHFRLYLFQPSHLWRSFFLRNVRCIVINPTASVVPAPTKAFDDPLRTHQGLGMLLAPPQDPQEAVAGVAMTATKIRALIAQSLHRPELASAHAQVGFEATSVEAMLQPLS